MRHLLRRTRISQWLPACLLAGLILLQVDGTLAAGQKKTATKTKASARVEESAPQQKMQARLSAWQIIEMTDWLFWPFVLLTATGVFLLSYKGLQELRERSRARDLLEQRISASELRRVVKQVQTAPPNRASRLMHQMISTFNKTNRAEPIGDDINTYLNSERDRFETFNRVLGFLSDTAGALGLLGTVWGIFETFHAGRLDGPTILKGMSISLVTTLVGLIISLFLNMGATSIFAFFNRQLNLLASRAEELRQALLYLEAKSARTTTVATEPRVRTVKHERAAAVRRPAEVPVGEVHTVASDGNGYL